MISVLFLKQAASHEYKGPVWKVVFEDGLERFVAVSPILKG
jgi:hypothetical protein